MRIRSYPSAAERAAERALYGPHALLLQPSYWAVRVYRFGRAGIGHHGLRSLVRHAWYFFLYSVVRLIVGIDLPRTVAVGPRLMIHHFGGIIVHPQATIGADCVLRHGVTIGERRPGGAVPTIGNGVVFGAYAQVLGSVHVGDGATIGALSLVLHDVEAGRTVVGQPARDLASR